MLVRPGLLLHAVDRGHQAPRLADRQQIIGIEPGAGLTKVSQEDVIPAYGLGDMKFLTSSTTGMLAELKKAVDAKQETS